MPGVISRVFLINSCADLRQAKLGFLLLSGLDTDGWDVVAVVAAEGDGAQGSVGFG